MAGGVWDLYVTETTPTRTPWARRLPDGTLLTAPYPTAGALRDLAAAVTTGNVAALLAAAFGENGHQALHLTRALPVATRLTIATDVLRHHLGVDLGGLGQVVALAETIDRVYDTPDGPVSLGEALHADLLAAGLDPYAYFTGARPWRELRIFLQHLPQHSHYRVARRNDPEVAEALAASPRTGERWTPPAEEWPSWVELLAAIYDRLGSVVTVTVNGYAKQPQEPPRAYPRPVTEVERARARADQRAEDELDALIDSAYSTWLTEHPEDGGAPTHP